MRTGTHVAGRRAAALLAVGVAASATLFAAPAAADAEPDRDCVGVVVDTGEGEPATSCVPFEPDLNGYEVLELAGHELTFDQNGFVCQIDQHPDTCTSDNTHFWAYYHRAPGAAEAEWAFSDKGGAQYVVHPGETEGWAYRNGPERQPEAIPYSTLQETADTEPADDQNEATGEDEDDGPPWLVLGVMAVIIVLGGVAARHTMARRQG